MMQGLFATIAFDYCIPGQAIPIALTADVQLHHSESFYVVNNFRLKGKTGASVLPEIQLKKLGNRWVHKDSGIESELGTAVGKAIDQLPKRA
jgi:hypothetical protein